MLNLTANGRLLTLSLFCFVLPALRELLDRLQSSVYDVLDSLALLIFLYFIGSLAALSFVIVRLYDFYYFYPWNYAVQTHRSFLPASFVCSCVYYITFFRFGLLCGVALIIILLIQKPCSCNVGNIRKLSYNYIQVIVFLLKVIGEEFQHDQPEREVLL